MCPMTEDERAIRELVATWMAASANGETDTVLSLMADDVVFMVPGQSRSARKSSLQPRAA